jgi:hypothetical protein
LTKYRYENKAWISAPHSFSFRKFMVMSTTSIAIDLIVTPKMVSSTGL